MTRPPWTCKSLERVVVVLAMKAMQSGTDQAWYTTGAGVHRGPAKNSESGCNTWMDKRPVVMKTLGRYRSIASRGQYGPYRGRMLANRNRLDRTHCRGQHGSGITKDAVGNIENGFLSES